VPNAQGDIVAEVEDAYRLGASALSDILHSKAKALKGRYTEVFGAYASVVDSLVQAVDSMASEGS
jgi:hypothetical protein